MFDAFPNPSCRLLKSLQNIMDTILERSINANRPCRSIHFGTQSQAFRRDFTQSMACERLCNH